MAVYQDIHEEVQKRMSAEAREAFDKLMEHVQNTMVGKAVVREEGEVCNDFAGCCRESLAVINKHLQITIMELCVSHSVDFHDFMDLFLDMMKEGNRRARIATDEMHARTMARDGNLN